MSWDFISYYPGFEPPDESSQRSNEALGEAAGQMFADGSTNGKSSEYPEIERIDAPEPIDPNDERQIAFWRACLSHDTQLSRQRAALMPDTCSYECPQPTGEVPVSSSWMDDFVDPTDLS